MFSCSCFPLNFKAVTTFPFLNSLLTFCICRSVRKCLWSPKRFTYRKRMIAKIPYVLRFYCSFCIDLSSSLNHTNNSHQCIHCKNHLKIKRMVKYSSMRPKIFCSVSHWVCSVLNNFHTCWDIREKLVEGMDIFNPFMYKLLRLLCRIFWQKIKASQ